MLQIISGAGIFIFPLGLCSILGVFVIFERAFALRNVHILPDALQNALIGGQLSEIPMEDSSSVLSRIVGFFRERSPDPQKLRAYANLEINRLERGLVILEIITGAAPLIGLLGTVTGLVGVFSSTSLDSGIPDQAAFIKGVSLALTTTMIGLAVAIPSLVAYNIFQRRIDTYTVQIEELIERLHSIDLAGGRRG